MQIYCWPEETKRMARILLKEAIKRKEIKPPKRCQVCGRDKWMLLKEKSETRSMFEIGKPSDTNRPIIAHHYNYLSPFNVWWLCEACHVDLHKYQRRHKCVVISLKGITTFFFQAEEEKRRKQKRAEDAEQRRLRWEQAQLTID